MMHNGIALIDKLCNTHSLSTEEYICLLQEYDAAAVSHARSLADRVRRKYYGNSVFIRGLIEISNVCKNDCFYCGIRRSNKSCSRYTLSREEILSCCEEGYALGFRTFVMQSGERCLPTDTICSIVSEIKSRFSDCAVTLSLGEYSREEYAAMRSAGADRYLLRHETADKAHYELLHPKEMSFENRLRCLYDLKELGFQVGCGFMVGSPHQSIQTLAKDLKLIEELQPDMCGIGPFIPHKQTPFASYPAGTAEGTVKLLSLVRLIRPNILLPATTALGTISPFGREEGILAGANVVMPNLSPLNVRKKYELYENKISTGEESAQSVRALAKRMENIGFNVVCDRGDIKSI